jgi:hypothetical protein
MQAQPNSNPSSYPQAQIASHEAQSGQESTTRGEAERCDHSNERHDGRDGSPDSVSSDGSGSSGSSGSSEHCQSPERGGHGQAKGGDDKKDKKDGDDGFIWGDAAALGCELVGHVGKNM